MLLFPLLLLRLEDLFNPQPLPPREQVSQLMQIGRFEEALKIIAKLLKDHKTPPSDLLLLRATCQCHASHSKECLADCTSLLRMKSATSSELRTALSLRALAQLQLGNFDASEKDAKSANDKQILTRISDARKLAQSAQAQFDAGQLDTAKSSLDRLLRVSPTAESLVLLRAEIAWMESDFDAFASLTGPFADSRASDSKLHYRRGVIQLCAGDLEAAKSSLQKCSRQPKAPGNATAALQTAAEIIEQRAKFERFFTSQNLEFAEIAFNRSQTASQLFCSAGSALGQSVMLLEYRLAKLKQYNNTQLLEMLERMIAVAPQAADLLLERGNVYLALKEFDAAIFDFNVVLTQSPDDKRAAKGLEKATKMKKEATHVDFYAVLGVKKSASPNEITRAYKRMAREWHPDRFADPEKKKYAEQMMKKINTAYDILKDERKRRVYDAGAAPDEIDEQAAATGFPFDLFGNDGEEDGQFTSPFDFFGGNMGGEGVQFEIRFGN
jgi:tetratricopeptide (TPR) repeat protein